MHKEARDTVLFLILLVSTFLLLDSIFGRFANYVLSIIPNSTNEIARMNTAVMKNESDIVVLGSSRASHHYQSQILEDSISMSVYNAGMEGRGATYADGVLKAIVSRYTPRAIILDMNYSEIDGRWNDKINTLKPYYRQFPNILELACKVEGEQERIKCVANTYLFNSMTINMLNSFISSRDDKKGFMPLYNKSNTTQLSFQPEETMLEHDSTYMYVIEDIIRTCKTHKIKLIAVVSPMLDSHKERSALLKEYFAQREVNFYDYSNHELLIIHPEWFYDQRHLNAEGAKAFTMLLSSDIKSILFDN